MYAKLIELYQKWNPIFFTFVIVYLTIYLVLWIRRFRQLPPGPWGLPLVGYLPFFKRDVYLEFDALAKVYGPVYSLKLGLRDVVIIADWDHLKEAFSNEELLARPHETFFPGILKTRSLIEMSGDDWREHRQTAISILKKVGFGKSQMEDMVIEEIDQFISLIDSWSGEPIDFEKRLMPSVSNNISILIFGHNYDYLDPWKQEMDEKFHIIVKYFQFAGLQAFLPWLYTILVTIGQIKIGLVAEATLWGSRFIQAEIDKHEEVFNENKVDDYIDGYLLERKKRQRKGLNIDQKFNIETLNRNSFDFFGAGTETITSTLTWAMFYLVKYPQNQDKIREEIGKVVGPNRKPVYADRINMPFTQAFIYENHRCSSVLASNLFRRAPKDIKIGQYTIPKDCVVIFNFWSIHYDPKLWDNPEQFNPNRFLSKDSSGKLEIEKPAYLVPFSGGKRACPGEVLANVELFLYLTKILQQFKISTDTTTDLIPDAHYGVSRRPKKMPNLIFTNSPI